ncbi:succinate dehydrogenase flavoprotein subunit [Komagataeibacter diospyri]|uniref:L-aspartate oxidase n=1 Tax=Komagataeibacter diospyri TaxID=1932662 RepID=UPI0011360DE8|nr:L-aspartate oxidase [Komagataeibacter diospyri]GCE89200.1 succinate dehydrogenase flavoprotein subunit [Komagataeibacter diospyri]
MTFLPPLGQLAGQPLIIGGGLAGVMTALSTGRPCVLVCPGRLDEIRPPLAASMLAQGGMAAAMGADDTPALHAADTLAAGAGLCDAMVVDNVTQAGPAAVERLTGLGVQWDRQADGSLQLGLEAAHGRRRIVHAGEDATGATIMRALVARVRQTSHITVVEHAHARDLLVRDGGVVGCVVVAGGRTVTLSTPAVVLATGGVGGLFADTTNPAGAMGRGLAMAARAGAVLGNMEFVQFHPTALSAGPEGQRLSLVSEAVRGEGATLIDETGERFTDELATRDSVSRAVWRHMMGGHSVYLDARTALGTDFSQHFPAISALCAVHGIDPATQPIPVRPAAHYHMGGIMVDHMGRTGVTGLWAAGEVACTGLHGANRLASNSLLEAVAFGTWIGQQLDGGLPQAATLPDGSLFPSDPPPTPPSLHLRRIMSRHAGVIRSGDGLRDGLKQIMPIVNTDAGLVCAAILFAALLRGESRGGHFRSDCPHAGAMATPSRFSLTDLDARLAEMRDTFSPAILNERMPS